MRQRTLACAVALAVLALAGCVGDEEVPPGMLRGEGGSLFHEDWPRRALPFGDGHDHDDPSQHFGLSTPNFHTLGFEPLVSAHLGQTPGGYGCSAAATAGDRVLSVANSFTTEVAVQITDVTDPTAPFFVGELVLENAHIYDIAITPDGAYVALAVSPFTDGPGVPTAASLAGRPAAASASPILWFDDACTGQRSAVEGPADALPYVSGVLLVDIGDPTAPTVADYWPMPPKGAHSIRAFDIRGETVIVAADAEFVSAMAYYIFLGIDETPLGPKLVPLGIFDPPEHTTRMLEDPQVGAVHDMWLQVHPVTDQVVGYFADWELGAFIVDLDDFAQPQVLSHWDPRDVFGRSVAAHGMQPIDGLWDGRHYAIGHEECGGAPEGLSTCPAWILDTTDPTDPLTIGAWTMPVEGEWDRPFTYSLHYTGIHGRTLFVSSYHGGLWAVDLGDLTTMPEPETIGVWLPDQVTSQPPDGVRNVVIDALSGYLFDLAPMIMDLDILDDGTIVTYDSMGGLHTLRFDETDPAPPPQPWPMDGFVFDAVPAP